jgi:integrase
MPTTVTHSFPAKHTPEIVNILLQMKNNGLSDYTIKNTSKLLTFLDQHTDLNNPDQVKTVIATHVSNNYKRNLCFAYEKYAQLQNIKWQMPHYRQDRKIRRIPTSEKLEMIIAKAGKTLATKLRISKETGLRPIEICTLKVKDIDLEQRTIYPSTAKHGTARALKISANLNTLLQTHIITHKLNPNDKLFKGNADAYGNTYRATRNALATKLQDPTIQQIKLYDFRHYYATMLYHKTRDILYVKQQLGHTNINNTLIYTQLININEDEWITRIANNVKEDQELLEHGFEYVTERDGIKIYRKRK